MRKIRIAGCVGAAWWLMNISSVLAGATGTVTLNGTVGSDCHMTDTLAMPTSVSLGALDQDGDKQIAFGFSCNVPFSYTLESKNGGFKQASTTTAAIVYTVATSLPTDSGKIVGDTCTSDQLVTGGVTCTFANSGTDISTSKSGTLDVSWKAATTAQAAGSYTDSLTINILPLP